ncbi:MAG: chloride channel protein [Chloroflexota bacterium]
MFNKKYSRWLERLASFETLSLSILAVIVGLATGITVWAFKWLIEGLAAFLFEYVVDWLAPLGSWSIALLPLTGGILVGLIARYGVGEEKLHGTAAIMQAVALSGGRLRYQRVPVKTAAAVLSIGSGASVGPEDPSVQIGANLGSLVGQWVHMSDERTRTLVAAGAASAIAAAFNAPIAGVFFALEIILGEIGGNALGMILIAAVSSSVFTQAVSGSQPAFQVPAYAFHSAWELPLYLILGVLAGLVSAIYVALLYRAQDFYHGWQAPKWLKTASAGLAVGLAGIFLPQVFGVGYETIDNILNLRETAPWLLLALLVAKLILTPISIGGGFFGGVFAPSLFIGATLGGAFGTIADRIFPNLVLSPAAYALVGMAAVLAGAVHAPLTASILLFEMTSDYRIILPLMFAVAISQIISQHIQRDSVYALGLARHGIRLDRGRDVEVLDTLTVGETMNTEVVALYENTSLALAAEVMAKKRRHGLPVLDSNGELVGILTLQDIDRAEEAGQSALPVGRVCTRQPLTAAPDEPLSAALRRMSQHDVGRLPVVAKDNPRQLVGVLRRAEVIQAYYLALTRRTAQRHREHGVRLDAITPDRVDVTDIIVEKGAVIVGKRMSEIAFPRECVIASVRRGRQVFIPHGDTVLEPGDILVVVAQGSARQVVLEMCLQDQV